MRAHGREPRVLARRGASAFVFSDLGHFRDGRPGPRVSAAPGRSHRLKSLEITARMKTRRGLCDDGIRRNEDEEELGEDSFLPSNKGDARAREPAGDTGEEKRRTEASRREQP